MFNSDEKPNQPEHGAFDNHLDDESTMPGENIENISTVEEELKSEVVRLKDQLLRALAETENLRRRAERERKETADYAITKFARDLLSISDNLSRALETIPENDTALSDPLKNFIEGIRLTERELTNIFERYNIKKIMPLNEKFDHNLHQAMFEAENAEVAPGTIIQVLQAGYVLQDRLLRPAMVGVAKSG